LLIDYRPQQHGEQAAEPFGSERTRRSARDHQREALIGRRQERGGGGRIEQGFHL